MRESNANMALLVRRYMIQEHKRPKVLPSCTYKMPTGCGNAYVVITFDVLGHPQETFVYNSKAGGCFACNSEAEGRLCSLFLRSEGDPKKIIKHLGGLTCANSLDELLSCPAAIARALEEMIGEPNR